MGKEAKDEVKEILESEMPSAKTEEPWAPATLVITALLNPHQVYVARYSKKQIRFLSESVSLLHIVRKYMTTEVSWLEELIRQYARLNKFEDGWVIKQAVGVAKTGSTRMLFNLSRWKRTLFGEEGD